MLWWLRTLLNCCVYITAIRHASTKAISKRHDYHAAQAGHSKQEEMQAVTALAQACCFAGIPVVPPALCEYFCLVLSCHMPPQGLLGAFNPPRQRLPQNSWDFLEGLAGFTFISTLCFTKYDTRSILLLHFCSINDDFFSGMVNSIGNFPWQDSFTLKNLIAEHVEFPNLVF